MNVRAAVILVIALGGCDRGKADSNETPAATTQTAAANSSARTDTAADETALKQLFNDYKKAIFGKDGPGAVALVSEKTIAYFDRMRTSALSAPADEVKAMSLIDRLMVVMLRARMKPAELEKMDGRKLFVHAVNQGWVGDEAKKLEPADVDVAGDQGSIGITNDRGDRLPPSSGFKAYREGGAWKLDVMSIAALGELAFRKALADLDPDPNKALLAVVSIVVGQPVTERIFEPPRPAKP